ncbi:MAG TPA: pseudouridine synthase [Pyrinomonadaceae bacterium]|nr:pseudouridine synthase [Pyrinomonadaceae bacterium]
MAQTIEGDVLKPPLPTIEGVAPSYQWLPPGDWQTVLDFLAERFPNVETSVWLSRMAKGQVVDETGRRLHEKSNYRAGACVFYYRELESEIKIPFEESVLYRDEHILAVDKPHFLPVIPSGRFLHETLLVRLKKKLELDDLVPIHRIDRETAGMVLFSLNPATRSLYASLFNDRKVEKVYEAIAPEARELVFPLTRRSRLVAGEPFFRMQEIDGEPNSETQIDILERRNGSNLYRLNAVTGKKHQIRLHLAALEIGIVNDKFYPQLSLDKEDDFSSPLKLLARSVSFKDPLTGREQCFESEREL